MCIKIEFRDTLNIEVVILFGLVLKKSIILENLCHCLYAFFFIVQFFHIDFLIKVRSVDRYSYESYLDGEGRWIDFVNNKTTSS